MTAAEWQRFLAVSLSAALLFGCSRVNSSPRPAASGSTATGSADGYGASNRAPRKKAPSGIFIETPVTPTSRLVLYGHEWKRDPTGSTVGSEDLPEMQDDGIEDSFTAYVTDDPNLRLFYMFVGNGNRIYVRERDKGKWVTMKTLFFEN